MNASVRILTLKCSIRSQSFCSQTKPINPIYNYNKENKILFGKLRKNKKQKDIEVISTNISPARDKHQSNCAEAEWIRKHSLRKYWKKYPAK